MGINKVAGIFAVGPQGNSVQVNASGQLYVTEAGPLLPFCYGEKGRAIGVDANGRLGVILATPLTQNDSPGASGAVDLAGLRQFDYVLDKNIVITEFSNPDAGAKYTFVLEQTGAGSFTVTWPSNVKWRGGTAPTLTAASGSIDVVSMLYRDRDSTFLADYGLDFS